MIKTSAKIYTIWTYRSTAWIVSINTGTSLVIIDFVMIDFETIFNRLKVDPMYMSWHLNSHSGTRDFGVRLERAWCWECCHFTIYLESGLSSTYVFILVKHWLYFLAFNQSCSSKLSKNIRYSYSPLYDYFLLRNLLTTEEGDTKSNRFRLSFMVLLNVILMLTFLTLGEHVFRRSSNDPFPLKTPPGRQVRLVEYQTDFGGGRSTRGRSGGRI